MISAIAVRRGMPARAASIALATAYQESKLRNIDHGDRDSLGLFQQRPSQGWGSAKQIQDPYYAINRFYDALAKIDGYQQMRITEAAQQVQRSGFPEAYEDHAPDGRALASALTGYSPARFSCVVHHGRGADRESPTGSRPHARAPSGPAATWRGPSVTLPQTPDGRAFDVDVSATGEVRQPPGLGDGVVPGRARLATAGGRDRLRRAELARRGPLRAGLACRPGSAPARTQLHVEVVAGS